MHCQFMKEEKTLHCSGVSFITFVKDVPRTGKGKQFKQGSLFQKLNVQSAPEAQ